jgi:adenylosuccinate synthase
VLRRQGRAARHPRAGHARREDPQEEDHGRARAQAADVAPVRARPAAQPAVAACVGAGVGPRDIDEVWGVAKAYATRVGAGPFPTELDDETGVEIRERGGEFGTTTGRPRRTGWLDLVALKYAARINSLTALVITKLDVLGGFDTIKVCTRYRGEEEATFDAFPYHQSVLHHAVGEYTELPGWREDISGVRNERDLPAATRDYLRFVSDYVGVPVVLVGVGPGRDQIIWTGQQPAAIAA